MDLKVLFILSTLIFIVGCSEHKKPISTPWGEDIGEVDSVGVGTAFSLDDIVSNGEMIVVTVSGADTYFDYHGKPMGTQYLLCEKFAQRIGVGVRVELCKDSSEMIDRLRSGDADIAICQLYKNGKNGVMACGPNTNGGRQSWAVNKKNRQLADSLNAWFTPSLLAEVKKEEKYVFSAQSVRRHVYAPMLNASRGQISPYDDYFKLYSQTARWDWRLMAAQCYQESTFDPKAYSWAGARGLMQIMPSTAASLGLAEADMYSPQANIEAASRYIARLNGLFADVRNPGERINYVLASYNGGHFHVRDAMSLARKHGRNPYRWDDVSEFVLKLSYPAYYNDPVVKYGYMRGRETVDYVSRIRSRWEKYRSQVKGGGSGFGIGGGSDYVPRKATRKSRFSI